MVAGVYLIVEFGRRPQPGDIAAMQWGGDPHRLFLCRTFALRYDQDLETIEVATYYAIPEDLLDKQREQRLFWYPLRLNESTEDYFLTAMEEHEVPERPVPPHLLFGTVLSQVTELIVNYIIIGYMKLSEYASKVGIQYQTAWKHYHKGLIPGAYQLATGTIIVPDDILQKPGKTGIDAAVYARVSSSENRDNLETQAERMTQYAIARGYRVVRVVKEVGSGINEGRKQFLSLLSAEGVDVIVVEHRERATRFGFAYIQTLLGSSGRRIEVVNEAENDKEELMQDLIAIITSFVASYDGRRRAKRKTEKLSEALKSNGHPG
jgi:putative resolvase